MTNQDLLREALTAEGLDDEAIERVRAYFRANDAGVSIDWTTRWRRERDAAKASAVAAVATMPDYHGAIERCQAGVAQSMGISTTFSRCSKPARKVRRITRDRPGGDGRLAVCLTHAKTRHEPGRWRGETNKYRGLSAPADEMVEPEYQP